MRRVRVSYRSVFHLHAALWARGHPRQMRQLWQLDGLFDVLPSQRSVRTGPRRPDKSHFERGARRNAPTSSSPGVGRNRGSSSLLRVLSPLATLCHPRTQAWVDARVWATPPAGGRAAAVRMYPCEYTATLTPPPPPLRRRQSILALLRLLRWLWYKTNANANFPSVISWLSTISALGTGRDGSNGVLGEWSRQSFLNCTRHRRMRETDNIFFLSIDTPWLSVAL